MKRLFATVVLLGTSLGGQAQEQEIQRALVQRDQMSAEFAARARGVPSQDLSDLHARQLRDVMTIPVSPELRPWQRARMAEEQILMLSPPVRRSVPDPDLSPLPLPGGPRGGVDPVLPQGLPY
jgi:hypothetical protein